MQRHRITLDCAFKLEDVVCLTINKDCDPGMVTGIYYRPNGVFYNVSWSDRSNTDHYECELSLLTDRPYIATT